MSIHILNSLTQKKEELIPLNPPKVNIYTCGVTVYDECHIGHARSLYILDLIRRYLKFRGFDITFVRNITDIDDKIINKANELNLSTKEVAERFTKSYYDDLKALGIEKADYEPKATENIPEMIKFIEGLIKKGFAYEVSGDVYFSVRKFKDYGKLSGQGLDEMLAGSRIEVDEKKLDPLDFVLWKKSKEGEPKWMSPWGEGRPGWHIECSTMSLKYLKTDTLDIHAGGRDLIFPHHENEIAQSEALTGKPFVRYWIHHGLLTIDSQKMAKSLGNFITVKKFIEEYKDIDLLKLFFLSTHYSNPIDYNEEKITEAKKNKKTFDDFFDKVNYWGLLKGTKKMASSVSDISEIDNICAEFEKAMDDNFNTPRAMAALFELVDLGSHFIDLDKEEAFRYARLKLGNFFNILGVSPKQKKDLPQELIKMAQEREEARREKDFKRADEIRDEIKKKFKYLIGDTATSATFTEI